MPKININTDFENILNPLYKRDYGYGRRSYYKYKGEWCWTIAKRVCTRFLGKNVNDAFSHYCKLVPVHLQKEFWQEFDKSYWRYRQRFRVDKNNNIYLDIKPKEKGPVYFRSFNYKTEKKYKEWWLVPQDKKRPKWMIPGVDYPLKDVNEYEVIQGFEKKFDSIKTKEYKRLFHEDKKARNKQLRKERKEKEKIVYCYLTQHEINKKVNEQDIIDRDRLGFDKNSFIGNGQNIK